MFFGMVVSSNDDGEEEFDLTDEDLPHGEIIFTSTPMATATATRVPTLQLSPSVTIIPPVGRHPRLWVRASDLSRLRSWAVVNNPTYQNGLAVLAAQAKADMAAVAMESFPDEVAEDEPMQYRLRVEAAGGPADVRFLHVLEGADAAASATAVSLVQSTSGTSFDGAVVGETAILFPVNLNDAFTGLTHHVPVTVSTHYITGLTPEGQLQRCHADGGKRNCGHGQ